VLACAYGLFGITVKPGYSYDQQAVRLEVEGRLASQSGANVPATRISCRLSHTVAVVDVDYLSFSQQYALKRLACDGSIEISASEWQVAQSLVMRGLASWCTPNTRGGCGTLGITEAGANAATQLLCGVEVGIPSWPRTC
jgi:hypothetical protein